MISDREGKYIKYFDGTNSISYQCNYKNGKLDGWYFEYYKYNIILAEKYFVNHIANGEERWYSDNGKIFLSMYNKNDAIEGECITYYK